MIPYSLHAAIILSGCLVFYKLLLQRETFYRLNRIVLLLCLVFSFALPLLPVPAQYSFRQATEVETGEMIVPTAIEERQLPGEQINPIIKNETTLVVPAEETPLITWSQAGRIVLALYWFGVIAFGINFLVQLTSLFYRAYSRPIIRDGKFRIVELAGDTAPCSFGNNIFINPEKYDWETYNQILLHEKIHIEQGHTWDIVFAELVLIFQWFNPFAWQYRKELENNLEFLTDDQLLQKNNVEKTSYQLSLLKVSAPHFPLSITTNYNQSLLKKRLAMMNAKRSNVHTTWKYLFIFPLLVLFVSLLNKPVAYAQQPTVSKKGGRAVNPEMQRNGMSTEGSWFATIKDDKISIQFKSSTDEKSMNNNTFLLSDFKELPRDKTGSFQLVRDAGTFNFTGKFEGNNGMGEYKFTGDKSFSDYLQKQGVEPANEQDLMVYTLVDLKRSYVDMLKAKGYAKLTKHNLIPLAALKVDETYIESLKNAGFANLGLEDLVPFKALGIDAAFIEDIRTAGYKNVSASQLISFKAQGIDGKYIADIRNATKTNGVPTDDEAATPGEKNTNTNTNTNTDANTNLNENLNDDLNAERNDNELDNITAIKALNIDAAYIESLRKAGYPNLSTNKLVAMKAQGITAEYIQGLHAMGFKNVSASNLIAVKAQNINAAFVNGLKGVGYYNLDLKDLIPVKALGIGPDYIKGFQDAGYKDLPLHQLVAMKAQGITPALVKEYKSLGLGEVSVNDVLAAKATGTTPTFIRSMKQKGHNLKSINKYIQLKTAVD